MLIKNNCYHLWQLYFILCFNVILFSFLKCYCQRLKLFYETLLLLSSHCRYHKQIWSTLLTRLELFLIFVNNYDQLVSYWKNVYAKVTLNCSICMQNQRCNRYQCGCNLYYEARNIKYWWLIIYDESLSVCLSCGLVIWDPFFKIKNLRMLNLARDQVNLFV